MQRQKRYLIEKRERLIYNRGFSPKYYSIDSVSYFRNLPVAVVWQLVAENLISLWDQHNGSPTVDEMLAFCGADNENTWFFHGYTIGPKRIDCRVTLEGFESHTALSPKRVEEFLWFNCGGETAVSDNGICWCWYD